MTKEGGSGTFKLRNRRSTSKDHTQQILLTRANSTPPLRQPNSPSTPSPTPPLLTTGGSTSPPLSPTSPASPTQLFPPPMTNGSATPIGTGSLRRSGSRAGSLTSIPESAAMQEALREAAEQLNTSKFKSDYQTQNQLTSTMTMRSKKLSTSSSSLFFAEGTAGQFVTVIEGGEEVFFFLVVNLISIFRWDF